MKFNKKSYTAIVAISLCVLMIAGTFAWTNFNAQITNVFRGAGSGSDPGDSGSGINPGGTLHNDFEPYGSHKDIYIENWGTEDLFVRIRLKEYMEQGSGAGLKAEYDPETGELVSNPQNSAQPLISGANINDTNTWEVHVPKENMPNESLEDLGFRKYWQWNMGGQKYYFPADETERVNMGFISDHSPAGLTATCVNDYGVQTRLTRNAQVLTMAQWVSDGSRVGDYWVIDTDGWAYWASPLRPGNTTGLLLNGVTRIEAPQLDYYYGVFAEAQMATRTGAEIDGFRNNYERFGDNERGGWTTYGQALLEKIVNVTLTGDSVESTFELTLEDIEILSELTEQNVAQIIVQYNNVEEAQATLSNVLNYSRELISDDELSLEQPIFIVEETFTGVNVSSIRVPDESNIHKVMALFEQDNNVRVVEPNYLVTLAQVPTNQLFNHQWALVNTGQVINGVAGTPGIDINIYPIYQANLNLQEVIVGVVDGGIDTSHPALRGRLLPGFDFINNSATVTEDGSDGHGTAVSTIIAGAWNDTELAGVAPNARIIPVRTFGDNRGTISDSVRGIDFAIDNGARIICCAWTTPNSSVALRNVIADNPNILFITAAGNYGDSEPRFPSGFDLPNIISVAAINNRGEMPSFSNYGSHIDFAAPGLGVLAISGGAPRNFDGTSASAAVMSGAAAIYLGMFPDASPASVRADFINSVTANPNSRTMSNGNVNLAAALDRAGNNLPPVVPTATPMPTVIPTVTPEPTAIPTVTPEPTAIPTVTPEPTAIPTVTPEPTAIPTVTPAPTAIPTVTPAPTAIPTVTPAPTAIPTVTPAPTVEPTADFSVSATNVTLPHASTTREITITSNAEWTASSSDSWLDVSPQSGSGNGTITITVPQNWNTVFNRSATITLTSAERDITINVTQDIFDVSMGTFVFRASFDWHFLTAPPNTTWTASSDSPWITIYPSSGTGNERITMSIMENTTQSYRRGRVTISSGGRDSHHLVTQSNLEPTYRNSGTGARPVP